VEILGQLGLPELLVRQVLKVLRVSRVILEIPVQQALQEQLALQELWVLQVPE
jgi:hypothetical protein